MVFPVLHGTFGEDGTLQGLLELADLPMSARACWAQRWAWIKPSSKMSCAPTTSRCCLPSSSPAARSNTDLPELIAGPRKSRAYPLFTKPANLGSSVGITKCRTRSDLMEGLMEAARYDRRVLVERGLEKPREIEISVLGNDEPQASLPGEVRARRRFLQLPAPNTWTIIPS